MHLKVLRSWPVLRPLSVCLKGHADQGDSWGLEINKCIPIFRREDLDQSGSLQWEQKLHADPQMLRHDWVHPACGYQGQTVSEKLDASSGEVTGSLNEGRAVDVLE